jgi:hypothetical protein
MQLFNRAERPQGQTGCAFPLYFPSLMAASNPPSGLAAPLVDTIFRHTFHPNRLELVKLLDLLAGAGKNTEDVESDLIEEHQS